MSTPTLYTEEELGRRGQTVELAGGEESHVRALRLSAGDAVSVTDGRGGLWSGELREEGRVRLEEPRDAPDPIPVELAFGVASRDRTLWLVEKAVELGALGLQPVEVARSRSVADAGRSESFWEKARRRAVSALKQCGGARLPEMRPVCELHAYLAHAGGARGPRILLDRDAEVPLRRRLEGWDGRPPARILLGPEGGLEPEERASCLDAGLRPAGLGRRVLRFETAGAAALAVAGQQLASPAGE